MVYLIMTAKRYRITYTRYTYTLVIRECKYMWIIILWIMTDADGIFFIQLET